MPTSRHGLASGGRPSPLTARRQTSLARVRKLPCFSNRELARMSGPQSDEGYGDNVRIDMISEHASPLAALGGADAGGQNVHVAALATALARRGHEVTVFTRRDSPRPPDAVRFAP